MAFPRHDMRRAKCGLGEIYFNFKISSDISGLRVPLNRSILLWDYFFNYPSHNNHGTTSTVQ